MKKLGLLVMPLMAVSLLASCGGSKPTNKCKVTIGDHNHLSFTTIDDKTLDAITIDKNKDFTFKMKATAESNDEGYKLPTQLYIYIGDSTVELEHNYYEIDEITKQYEAKVTIKGEKIIDDIKISGEGVPEGYYAVDVSKCFGVGAKIETQYSPYLYTNQDGVVTFTQEGTYELPAAENIIVKFDDKDWINPSDDSEWCTYDTNTHELTLKKDKAISNVMIRARSPKYQILDELDWKKISDYSSHGYAPYLFYIGDTKTVEVNGLNHKVRIIGFNQDKDLEGNSVGITFEFANVITDSNGKAVTTKWNIKEPKTNEPNNYDFPDSTFNDLLNEGDNSIFKALPIGLQQAIKIVNKKVGLDSSYSTKTPYSTKLFPLAHDEMVNNESYVADGEGTKYQYYIDHPNDADRIKRKVGGEVGEFYWLRSPYTGNCSYYAWSVRDGGRLYYYNIYNYAFAVAPAFCI